MSIGVEVMWGYHQLILFKFDYNLRDDVNWGGSDVRLLFDHMLETFGSLHRKN
jgi:hypothetical protein